jgi:hypothetical protein
MQLRKYPRECYLASCSLDWRAQKERKGIIHIEREFAFYLTRDMDAIRETFSCVPLAAIVFRPARGFHSVFPDWRHKKTTSERDGEV